MSYKKLDLYSKYLEYFEIKSVEAMPIFLKTKKEAYEYYNNYVNDFVDDEYVEICKENIGYLVTWKGQDYYDIFWVYPCVNLKVLFQVDYRDMPWNLLYRWGFDKIFGTSRVRWVSKENVENLWLSNSQLLVPK